MSQFICGPNSSIWGVWWRSATRTNSVEHMVGTTSDSEGMAHSWYDWALAVVTHGSAISAQGPVIHMLTVLIQVRLIAVLNVFPVKHWISDKMSLVR